MFILTILFLMLLILTVFTVLSISVLGSIGVVVFGDIIVCGLVIAWIIKKLIDKRK